MLVEVVRKQHGEIIHREVIEFAARRAVREQTSSKPTHKIKKREFFPRSTKSISKKLSSRLHGMAQLATYGGTPINRQAAGWYR